MRLLADENIPLPSVEALRAAGHDIVSMTVEAPGTLDRAVLQRAHAEQRLLLTFDRDFGELVYARGESAGSGVMLFRFVPTSPTEPAEFVLALAERTGITLLGHYTVVERGHVRQRRLPP